MIYLLIFLGVLTLISWICTIRLKRQNDAEAVLNEAIITANEKQQQENKELKAEQEKEEKKLFALRESVQAQSNILKSLTETAEAEKSRAQDRAQQQYDIAVAALKTEYDAIVEDFQEKADRQKEAINNHLALNQLEIAKQEKQIQTLKDLQNSYLEAQKVKLEAIQKKDYYRLALSTGDHSDIVSLRSIQKQFNRPEAIDKLIWELYVKPAYDILMSHLVPNKDKVCGIYMITNITTEQSYVGQSVDCKERFRQHIKSGLASGPATNKLYQAMKQYGVDDFIFQILEEVPREKLNEREVFWIDFYQTKTYGLNKTAGGS